MEAVGREMTTTSLDVVIDVTKSLPDSRHRAQLQPTITNRAKQVPTIDCCCCGLYYAPLGVLV